ncbi:MAG: 16S rRNA (adenine(1518)-N(6)/adenine(1519)-N(6))-dimethyltransferase RsmA [Halanaerobiales bacterium]
MNLQKKIATPGATKELLGKYNLRLSRKLGQNFLVDRNIIDIIISAGDIKKDDIVIEIGPGIGSLTQAILEKLSGGKLYAIEKDNRLVEVLDDLFSSYKNLEVINMDVMNIDWNNFFEENKLYNKKIKLMANLPYYITTPIIMGLLEAKVPIDCYVFMVQKEVAERMIADPGGKDYGSLSIAVQYYSNPEIVHIVPSSVFIPRPAVESAIIKLNRRIESPVQLEDEEFFFKIVQAIFQQRRKNIKNSLVKAANIDLEKEDVLQSLDQMGLEKRIRGEKLSLEQMGQLSNLIYKKKHN